MPLICVELLQYVEIDEQDVDLSKYGWCLNNLGYAHAWIDNKLVLLHRLIGDRMGLSQSKDVDHKDRNKLNNKRNNLREATKRQTCINRENKNTTGYRGVFKSLNKWRARIRTIDNKRIDLGSYESIIDAAKAYDDAAKIFHGEFAIFNFEDSNARDSRKESGVFEIR